MDMSIPDFRSPLTFYVISSFFQKILKAITQPIFIKFFLYKETYFICNSLSDFWFLKRNGTV
jgi:hypothetical protein